MLILTRKVGQKLIIEDNIELTVVDVSHTQVKIGINAPKNVSVFREEVYRQIKDANYNSDKTTEETIEILQNLLHNSEQGKGNKLDSISAKIRKNH